MLKKIITTFLLNSVVWGQIPNVPGGLTGTADGNVTPVGVDRHYCKPDETTYFPGGATKDDGMNLPQNCTRTDMADTPANGPIVNVAAGDAAAFQAALNTAVCGERIILQAGSTYTGSFVFPSNTCDRLHWIWVLTSAMNLLPPEHSRITPCYANVQLPNRPSAPGEPGKCPVMVVAMAKLKGSGTLDETVRFNAGVNSIRIMGIEIEAKTVARTVQAQNVINWLPGVASHFVFDRVWIHGTPDQSLVRAGFMQDGVSNVAVVDSSYTDGHCLNGVCTDSQFFQGGSGSLPKKAFLGANNWVESAGTNSMSFGGLGATVMPTDFIWMDNDQYKPWSWNPACVAPLPPSCKLPDGTPVTYDGLGPYSTKNQFEVKSIIRALVEHNKMRNNWMHADQNATAILITPKNQKGNLCPACEAIDVIIRYNHVISAGGFLQAVNAGADDGGLATTGCCYTVHDNLAEDLYFQGVSNTGFSFNAFGFYTTSVTSLPCTNSFIQHDVHMFNNTVVTAAGRNYNAMYLLDGPGTPPPNPLITPTGCELGMQFYNNIAFYGGQGVNQTSNFACAGPTSTQFANKFTNCWTTTLVYTKNLIVNGTGTWGSGNFTAPLANVGFVNYNNGLNGDYRLCTGPGVPAASCTAASPYHNAGTNGKDLGADISKVPM